HDVMLRKLAPLARKELAVPAGILSDLIVSQRKGAPFCFRQPLHPNHRHLLQAKQNCRGIAAATGNDVVTIVDQNRHHKAEGGDTVRDLADLLLRMGSRVARIGFKRVDRDRLHCYHESLLLKSRPGTRNFLLPANGRGFLSVSSQSIAKWLIVASKRPDIVTNRFV